MSDYYLVDLTAEERASLVDTTTAGTHGARFLKRVNILLMADGHAHTDEDIARALSTSLSTIHRTRQRFVEGGLSHALSEKSRPVPARKLDGKHQALLVAIACSKPPPGQARWTLQLLADRLVALTDLEDVSIETVRRRLEELELKPWQKKMWCIPKFDATFVAQMEHILDLYAQPADPRRPVVNFDETLKQLIADVQPPMPARPGQPQRYDHHYRRNGTANLFVFFDRHRKWRHVKVTQTKTFTDFAHCMKDLVDVHYPEAEVIRVVLDNLSAHKPAALYQTFPPEEARRILRRLEFHYTPVHASWLNMVEIEIGVLSRQCLDQRIGEFDTLCSEVAAWGDTRNAEGATIRWLFSVEDARTKLARAYPNLSEPL